MFFDSKANKHQTEQAVLMPLDGNVAKIDALIMLDSKTEVVVCFFFALFQTGCIMHISEIRNI